MGGHPNVGNERYQRLESLHNDARCSKHVVRHRKNSVCNDENNDATTSPPTMKDEIYPTECASAAECTFLHLCTPLYTSALLSFAFSNENRHRGFSEQSKQVAVDTERLVYHAGWVAKVIQVRTGGLRCYVLVVISLQRVSCVSIYAVAKRPGMHPCFRQAEWLCSRRAGNRTFAYVDVFFPETTLPSLTLNML